MSYDRVKSALPTVPFPHSVRKCTMRRETFIDIHIVSAHFFMLSNIIAQAQISASREFPPDTGSLFFVDSMQAKSMCVKR